MLRLKFKKSKKKKTMVRSGATGRPMTVNKTTANNLRRNKLFKGKGKIRKVGKSYRVYT